MTMTNFNPAVLLRDEMRTLDAYDAPVIPGVVKMDANENPFDFPGAVKDAITKEMGAQAFTRYPDPMARELLSGLAGYTGLPVDCLLAGNGSDELILTLLLTFGTGGTVPVAVPTFSMYRVHSVIAGARPIFIPRRPDFSVDAGAMADAGRSPDARVMFLCSPNNPTCNITPPEVIADIAGASRCLVVVDEAYIEFGGESCLQLIGKYPNLVILRTFSKAFGLAGLRVGYLAASPEVVGLLKKVKHPYNLNAYSQIAARAVLQHQDIFSQQIKEILNLRQELRKDLANLPGIQVYPGEANFILFRTPLGAGEVFEGLLERGILIRNVHSPSLEDCLRVTVGQREENSLFIKALADMLQQKEVS